MSDYIPRENTVAIIQGLKGHNTGEVVNDYLVAYSNRTIETAIRVLKRMPPADVVDVVRCRECENYVKHDKRCKYWNHGVESDGFCSMGERREDE